MPPGKITQKKRIDFQDLMLYRVHEILLVASPYDAFILEEDGRLTEQILHEYIGMNFNYAPRVWQANSAKAALEMLSKRKLDIVIVMMRIADMNPLSFGLKVKKMYPRKPVILLAFDESEIKQLSEEALQNSMDRVFVWSGNANVFPAIIKQIEDRKNSKRDILEGDVRAIILVEDTSRYYSLMLPFIYQEIMYHTKHLVGKSLNDTQRLLHLRGRPKILLATNYSEAKTCFNRYQSNILGIISDIRFPMNGEMNSEAGIKFIEYVRKKEPNMPVMLQSTDEKHAIKAQQIHAVYLNKQSSTLLQDLRKFILNNFGFGDFIFRNKAGKKLARASDLKTLRNRLLRIPKNSLAYHASSNHFSNWIAARGEFDLAAILKPLTISDFKDIDHLRSEMIESINEILDIQQKSQMTEFTSEVKPQETDFIRISTGSLGGKARGLGFMNSVITKSQLQNKFPNVNIRIPRLAVIGTDEFDQFMNDNNLWVKASNAQSNSSVEKLFLRSKLPKNLRKKLKTFLSEVQYPIAVRSSALLEDSMYQPLAGMYATYMLPNTAKNKETRFNQLCEAIKRVYASTYFQEPKTLLKNSVQKREEEKMGVILMELIGQKHGSRFYPTLSGTAQSLNYYPVSYMKRDEGIATIALGMGRTVVNRENALRFSPKYPTILPQFYSVKATIQNSQNSFYALNLNSNNNFLKYGEKGNLKSYDLDTAEKDGTLDWAGSVVSLEDNIVRDSLQYPGTRVITFAPVLKWNSFPLSEILAEILKIGKKSLGGHVEIEYSVNLYKDIDKPPEFCLLQIKPMLLSTLNIKKDSAFINDKDIICKSGVVLGNGKIEGIKDIIFVNPKTFRTENTIKISKEIESYNKKLGSTQPYILVGPGRWGSADPWLGVPINWTHISGAKVIIELGLEKFPVDPSFGSHFFQNVTGMRIGYFTINHKGDQDYFNMDWIHQQTVKDKKTHTAWIQTEKSLIVMINGQNGEGIIQRQPDIVEEIMDEEQSTGI